MPHNPPQSFFPSPSIISMHPLPALTLSFSLIQNIHKLLLLKRHLQNIQAIQANTMESLVELASLKTRISILQDLVEMEVESAWVTASFLPPREKRISLLGLERKLSFTGAEHHEATKREESYGGKGEWNFGELIQPLGIPTAVIPLNERERGRGLESGVGRLQYWGNRGEGRVGKEEILGGRRVLVL